MPKKTSATPTPIPSTLKKSESEGKQRTLHGFFSKTPTPAAVTKLPERSSPRKPKLNDKFTAPARSSNLTPAPSSDAIAPEDDEEPKASEPSANSLPSPVSTDEAQTNGTEEVTANGTPSRRVC